MHNRPLSSYVPDIYKDIVEMDDIINSEQKLMDNIQEELLVAFANTFVLTANESGVIMFEKMLNIIANPRVEDLEFRRQRILNRVSISPPFTFRFLKNKLDEIIGKNKWRAYIDFENYTLYIESSATDQNWYYEVEYTINRIKPCNIVFINIPYTASGVNVSEEISYATQKWRYRLGSWKLGEYPFTTPDGGGIIKMADIKSLGQTLLNDTANFVLSDIAYVLVNNSIRIDDFRTKQVDNNVVTIEYNIMEHMTNLMTDVKLMNANDEVLSQTTVYVPITQLVIGKHTITVKEGV